MRDIVWTLIIIWLVYKLIDIFRVGSKKSYANSASSNQSKQNNEQQYQTNFSSKKDPKEAIQKSTDKEGDYVDFEELK